MGQLGRQNAPQPYDVYKKDEVYNKTEQDVTDDAQDAVDATKANAADVYTKTEINNLPTDSFKNKLINGGFDTWQRGISFTNVGFTADRWYSTSSDYAFGQEVLGDGDFMYGLWSTRASSNIHAVQQYIELPATGKKGRLKGIHTITVYAYSQDGLGTIRFGALWNDGTSNGNPSAIMYSAETHNLSSTLTKYTFTIDLDAVAVGVTNTALRFYCLAENITLGQKFVFTGVQLEEGSIATPFENRPIGVELALCKRYYQSFLNDRNVTILSTYVIAGFTYYHGVQLVPDMRIAPTISNITSNGAGFPANNAALNSSRVDSVRFHATTDGSSNSGYLSVFFTADAEL